jgi:hypothetical protein
MIVLVRCPNCETEGMDMKEVFNVKKPKVVSIEEAYKEVLSKYNTQGSSGDMSYGFFSIATPLQVVYSCRHCGYTKVFDKEVKK